MSRIPTFLVALAFMALPIASAIGSTRLPTLLGDAARGGLTWQVRPASIGYTGDGSGVLGGFDGTGNGHPGHLTWTSWTTRSALGKGAIWVDDCTPDCAHGTFTPHAVELRAFRPRKGHFTRLTLRYRYHGKRYVDRRGIARLGGSWSYYIVSTARRHSRARVAALA